MEKNKDVEGRTRDAERERETDRQTEEEEKKKIFPILTCIKALPRSNIEKEKSKYQASCHCHT